MIILIPLVAAAQSPPPINYQQKICPLFFMDNYKMAASVVAIRLWRTCIPMGSNTDPVWSRAAPSTQPITKMVDIS